MPLEVVWRPKRPSALTDSQRADKLQKDSEYEIAVMNLYATLPREQAIAEKKKLWDAYLEWAKANGLYEEVTPEQRLAEAEAGLVAQVEQLNLIRAELKKPLLEIKEKVK